MGCNLPNSQFFTCTQWQGELFDSFLRNMTEMLLVWKTHWSEIGWFARSRNPGWGRGAVWDRCHCRNVHSDMQSCGTLQSQVGNVAGTCGKASGRTGYRQCSLNVIRIWIAVKTRGRNAPCWKVWFDVDWKIFPTNRTQWRKYQKVHREAELSCAGQLAARVQNTTWRQCTWYQSRLTLRKEHLLTVISTTSDIPTWSRNNSLETNDPCVMDTLREGGKWSVKVENIRLQASKGMDIIAGTTTHWHHDQITKVASTQVMTYHPAQRWMSILFMEQGSTRSGRGGEVGISWRKTGTPLVKVGHCQTLETIWDWSQIPTLVLDGSENRWR